MLNTKLQIRLILIYFHQKMLLAFAMQIESIPKINILPNFHTACIQNLVKHTKGFIQRNFFFFIETTRGCKHASLNQLYTSTFNNKAEIYV